jgi:hypothetical protein
MINYFVKVGLELADAMRIALGAGFHKGIALKLDRFIDF